MNQYQIESAYLADVKAFAGNAISMASNNDPSMTTEKTRAERVLVSETLDKVQARYVIDLLNRDLMSHLDFAVFTKLRNAARAFLKGKGLNEYTAMGAGASVLPAFGSNREAYVSYLQEFYGDEIGLEKPVDEQRSFRDLLAVRRPVEDSASEEPVTQEEENDEPEKKVFDSVEELVREKTSLTLVEDFIQANIEGEDVQEQVRALCNAFNIVVAEQIPALRSSEIVPFFDNRKSARSFAMSLNRCSAGVFSRIKFSGFDSDADRKALGMKFSEEAGGDVFPKKPLESVKRVIDFLAEKGLCKSDSDLDYKLL